MFFAATGIGSFLATAVTPTLVRRWGRYAAPNGALAFAALVQLCGSGLQLPVMMLCGFLLGAAGQVVKLGADTAMQIDVDDALRGHVFTVQDSLFWMAFIAAMALARDGHSCGRPLPRAGVRGLGGVPARPGCSRHASAAAPTTRIR